jgi:uncharacterized membrane protein YdjX (TVP38/TMEM64 family)
LALSFVALSHPDSSLSSYVLSSSDEYAQLKRFPPNDVDDLRALASFLSSYRDQNYMAVLVGFCALYVFMQTFAIPGTIFLSILAGPLFGTWKGLAVVSMCATCGASMCYLLSQFLAHDLVSKLYPDGLAMFRAKIDHHRHNLFFYMLFLRLTPILPNVLISLASPIISVPLAPFFFATLFGLVPANYIYVTTGLALGEMESLSSMNPYRFVGLLLIGCVALLPTIFRSKLEELDEATSDDKLEKTD